MSQSHRPNFADLAKKWPSTLVARKELPVFTGGILHPRTMANLDALNQGIPGRVKIGRTVAYPVENVIKFMEERAQVCGE